MRISRTMGGDPWSVSEEHIDGEAHRQAQGSAADRAGTSIGMDEFAREG